MEILTSVVGKVADYTVVPIRRQASYLIFYKGNLKMLADHVKDLQTARERMIHLVEEERGNGKEIETNVLNWLEKVYEVIERANQLQEDPRRANVRCSTWGFPNMILRYQLSRNATKISNNVVQVEGEGMFDQVGYLPIVDETRYSEKYETRVSLKNDIVKALADLNSCNIGVYGLAGVGKTTLVEDVALMVKKHKLFDKVVKTHVSFNPDFKTIQGEIADFLGLRLDEETIFGRAHRLRQRIKMEKSILVILDDIRTRLDLEKVGIPIGNEHNGCKLLMTYRDQFVLLQMNVPMDYAFKLELMEENEAWRLFQYMAGDVVKDSNLKDVAIQVAKECGGLPLRVVMVACAMRNRRDVQSWEDALRKLQSDDPTVPIVDYALEMSYNSLKSDEIRDIFLLFSLIMQDNNVEYFLKVAIGLDILKHVNTVDDARIKLYAIIRSLTADCFLLDVKTDGVIQMHDFVRDFAISKARRDKHVFLGKHRNEEWPTNDFFKRCTHISLLDYQNDELPQTIYCPNIKFFILFCKSRSLEIPNNFFEGMQSLTVLDLIHLNLYSLPTSFRFLTNLQTLCLTSCILKNMDAIEALQNLKILRLCKSSMIKLPREIGKLTQLRMLDLSNSGMELVPPNIISSLIRLEELYMGNTSINWEDVNSTTQTENASIAELGKLPNLVALELQIRETLKLPRDLQLMFEKLKRYKIVVGDVWEWSDIMYGTLNTLMLKLGTNILLEHGIKALIKGVENLYLDDVDGIQNVLYQLNEEGFPLLKHLHVQNNANMKHIVDSKERNQIYVSFPILETLVLHNLENLEHICHGPLSVTSFGSLSVIKVKNCIKLKCILSFTMIKALSCLSEIDICECNSVKEIVLEDNKLSANNDVANEKIEFPQLRSLTLEHLETLDNFFFYHLTDSRSKQTYQGLESYISSAFFNAQVVFPNLHTLKLSSLPNLNKIWEDSHHSMYNLTNLTVDDCGGLEYLFSSAVVASFKNLKQLKISSCPMMEEIIAKEERDNAMEEVVFPNLHTLKLSSLPNLNKIWEDSHHSMYNLTNLTVDDCGGLEYLFSSAVVASFKNLKQLKISSCPMMEEIIAKEERDNALEEVHFLKLETIILLDMDNLKTIWHRQFKTVKILDVAFCENIVVVFPSSMQNTYNKLEMLKVEYCVSVEEIFELTFNESSIVEDTTQLKEVALLSMPKLKKIWSGDPQEILSFQNLINVKLEYCKGLEYLLPLSVATRCSHLKELYITECENIKEIVAEEKESSVNVAPIFEFNQLSTLLLRNLGKLEGLYAKEHTLLCPSLKTIDVFNCAKLDLYRTLSTRSSNFLDDQLSDLAHQPLFIAEEVIPNLEMLRIDNKEANMILQAHNSSVLFTKMTYLALCAYKNEDTFPYLFLQNAGSLESLSVEQSCFEKIFQDEGQISEKTHTRLKNLYLIKLPKLQHICEEGSQIDPVLEVLQVLWVTNCSSLINLLPSSATLSHLEYMDITDCKGLKSLITSPTMQSLHKLRRLKVENCCSLEEVITGEENIQITLISLQKLVLKWLPRLNQFCSKKCFLKFPLLEVVIVRDCPRMKVFSEGYTSTPNLQKVQIVEDGEEWFWKGNINDTITNMFEDKEVLRSNTLNETIISSHLQDDELGSKDGVDSNLEE